MTDTVKLARIGGSIVLAAILVAAALRAVGGGAAVVPKLDYALIGLTSSDDVTARKPPPPPVAPPAPAAFVLRRVLPIARPFRHGDWVWDEAGAPAGPVVVTIDLAAQVLSVFRGGYEIGTAVILYGADEKPTPLGAFPITQKDAHHVSNLYHAPMPYMLRLTNDGVTIHGSDVRLGAATHGCVGVPVAFARKLFGVAKIGDVVIVTNGKTMQVGDRIVRS